MKKMMDTPIGNNGKGRKAKEATPCNICGRVFVARTRFARFCPACKADSDVFGYAEWLPQATIQGFTQDPFFREAA